MTSGLVIGKFYPLHRGHKFLIETARRQVDRLTVMLCVHESQTIPGHLRKAWLEESHPDCEVVAVPDTLPEEPVAWARFVVETFGRAPDVVFSSEDYGAPFAAAMGSRHVMVDRGRRTVPVSGTAVRDDPLGHWEFLEPCVRAYFVKRVVVTGAESTGKTTLARRLAERFGTEWVPEYGREYWETVKLGGSAITDIATFRVPEWQSEEFVLIAETQQSREDAAARRAEKVLFCDTDAFATGLWHERYMGSRSPEVEAVGRRRRPDLVLLCAPDVPFVQDGFRDGESVRTTMHGTFLIRLAEGAIVPRVLTGDWKAREVRAVRAVQSLMK
ncbi:MAG: AAA family ATPase [Armatimonadetes bacterium]|nr:AAA family ATPase [Armatimonadota bacterium]